MRNTLGPFPPAAKQPRPMLTPQRWQSFMMDTWTVGQPIEIPVSGRRVITSPAVGYVPYDLLDSTDASVIGAYAIDPDCQIILWFDNVGVNEPVLVVPGSGYHRLNGTGVYIPMGSPAEFAIPFRRLFFEVSLYDTIGFKLPQVILDVETYTEAEGDRV